MQSLNGTSHAPNQRILLALIKSLVNDETKKRPLMLLVMAALFSCSALAQSLPSQRQFKRPKSGVMPYGYLEYQPSNYASAANGSLPLVFFLHGIGEAGDGSDAQLSKLLQNGLPLYINTNKPGFSDFPFIMISPQVSSTDWFSSINAFFDYIIANYPKADLNRIYATGLSYGGGGTFRLGWGKAGKLAGILPIASAYMGTSSAKYMTNLPVWAFHNIHDTTVDPKGTTEIIKAITAAGGHPNMTLYDATGHNCWDKTYTTQEVWDWLLSQRRNNKSPLADAGADVTVHLPTNIVTLPGSATDADGSIASYAWSKVSGPSTYTMSGSETSTLTVKNLVAGKYVLRLKVKDNAGIIDIDEIVLNVISNPSPVVNAGTDQSITIPLAESSTISGTATDADGIKSYTWTQVSGPAVTLSNTSTSSLTLSDFESAGLYTMRLTAEDVYGAKSSDDVVVYVSQRIEGETGALHDAAPTGISNAGVKTIAAQSNGKSMMISLGDYVEIPLSVPQGNYFIKAWLRSGAYTIDNTTSPPSYPYDNPTSFWPDKYEFKLNGKVVTFTGETNTISPKVTYYGNSYWGFMKSDVMSVTETRVLRITSGKSNYAGIDFIEIYPAGDPAVQRLSNETALSEGETTFTAMVFPNPFKNAIIIPLNKEEVRAKKITWTLLDMTGKNLMQKEASVEQSQLHINNLDNLQEENYIIKIATASTHRTLRVRKE